MPNNPPPTLDALAFVSPISKRVVLGFDISAYRFARPVRKVCQYFIQTEISPIEASDIARRSKEARDNVLSHSMPRSLYSVTSSADLAKAFDVLQENTTFRVTLYETATNRFVECERPALGDSIALSEKAASP